MINYKFIEKLGKTIDELYIENQLKYNKLTSIQVLEIYFNKKSLKDKERILKDALFGC